MPLAQIIGVLVRISVFATVFAIGLGAPLKDVGYLLHKPQLFVRSLLAMYVATPVVAVLLAHFVPAPLPVRIAVFLMAISAGAPMLSKKLVKLGASTQYVHSLSVLMGLLAAGTVPLSLWLLSTFFGADVRVEPGQVASTVMKGFLAPLLAGMALRLFAPGLAQRIGGPLATAAGVLLAVLVVLIVAASFKAILAVGLPGLAIIVLMTFAALAIGHVLGGPDPGDRTTLAVACATRFPGLALLVASLNFPSGNAVPVVVAYVLISSLAAFPYLRMRQAAVPK